MSDPIDLLPGTPVEWFETRHGAPADADDPDAVRHADVIEDAYRASAGGPVELYFVGCVRRITGSFTTTVKADQLRPATNPQIGPPAVQ
ncbi:hypothetical protein [Nocardia asteroides]|uniref:hypothetical protein n=1 Tax=Nocardia asteroides TaxID=1824 RepID=UPI001E2ED44C|nr:hypothetical protein [Nocardia asteroides]UGT59876.1 hypothetical protein LTT61_21970 [Nocardia asteroides]